MDCRKLLCATSEVCHTLVKTIILQGVIIAFLDMNRTAFIKQ